MPFIKLNQPKYLSEGQYLITDTDPDSTYFDVSEVPDILTGGKNLFMLKGNRSLLAPGSTIEIEVTDLNGRSIYHENAVYLEPGTKRRAVAIYVYEQTPQGGGVITITGTAQKRPNGKSVSLDLQKTPNVKWQKKINILPKNENRTRVILNRTPVVQIKEVEKIYYTPTGGILTNYQVDQSNALGFEGWISYELGQYASTISTTGSYFVQGMIGEQINFFNITDAFTIFPESTFYTSTLTNGPTNYITTIVDVINSTTAQVHPPWETSVDTQYGANINTNMLYPQGFVQGPHHILSYEINTTWAGTEQNSQSWAKIDIAELDPICGDIKRLSVHKKSQGMQQWQFVTDVVLENKEVLANDTAEGFDQNLGEFRDQATLDDYWQTSYGGFIGVALGTLPSKLSDSDQFLNGALITGSEALKSLTYETSRLDGYAEFRMKPSADWNSDGTSTAGLALKANTSYILSMKLAAQGVNDGVDRPVIKIFASGSAIDLTSEDSTMRKFATIQADSVYLGPPFNSAGLPAIIDESTLNYHFDVSTAGDMAVVFRIVSGRWWISDISVKPASQTGFTPNYTSVEFPMDQITQQNDIIDFKFELYDNIDNLVHTETTSSLLWSGGNTYINGDNNYLGDGIILDGE